MHNRFIPTWLRQFKKVEIEIEKPTLAKELQDSFRRLETSFKIASITSISFMFIVIGFVIWMFVK